LWLQLFLIPSHYLYVSGKIAKLANLNLLVESLGLPLRGLAVIVK